MKINKKISTVALILISFSFCEKIFATSFFSGYAGGKLNYGANSAAEKFDPDLKLQAFFAGQFNFSENVWSRLEFSLDTQDLITENFFTATPSLFQVDEISLIARIPSQNAANYVSAFLGTYDPIGSDVFLRRYFNSDSITSKLTDSYLGLAGSILYPLFGFGISDVIKFYQIPFAAGAYAYFNHEDSKYYVFNADLRAACVFRYFTCDFAIGLGIPLANNQEDYLIAISKLYWHVGMTTLFGNNYTSASLFLQAGLYNATFDNNKDVIIGKNNVYFLLEPRFFIDNLHVNVSFYSLPPDTVRKILFVDDTLGFDANFYSDSVQIGTKNFTLGSHFSFSFKDKSIFDIKEIDLAGKNFNINIAPYVCTEFLSGEIHLQGKIKLMEFSENVAKAFSFDVGYRTSF